MSDLIGKQYKDLVDQLEQNLVDLIGGKELPRVVFIEAPSGSGKSRIVRELYERLRHNPMFNNLSPAGKCYWPPLTPDVYIEDGINSGFQLRKELGPDLNNFSREPNTLPGFMWYSIRCDVLTGNSTNSAMEFIGPRMRAHSKFVAHSIIKSLSPKEKIAKKAKNVLRAEEWDEFRDVAFGELVLKIFEKFEILQGVPFVAYGIDKGLALFRTVREKLDFRDSLISGGEIRAELASAENIYKALIGMAHKSVPVILAIEDIHLASDEVAGLVAALSVKVPNRPVFVIGTSWPESAERPVYKALVESLSGPESGESPRLLKIGYNAKVNHFPKLNQVEKSKFVSAYAPKTPKIRAQQVAALYENPFAIKLAMSGNYMQNRILNGELRISDKDLGKAPKSVEEIYRARWKELPLSVRQILMSAAALMPTAERSSGRLYYFLQESFLEAIETFKVEKNWNWNPYDTLSLAKFRHHWLFSLPNSSNLDLQFKEWMMQEIARHELLEYFTPEEIWSFRNITANSVSKQIIEKSEATSNGEILNWRDIRTFRACEFLLSIKEMDAFDELPIKAIRISDLTLGDLAHKKGRYNSILHHFKTEYLPLDTEFGIWGRYVRVWVKAELRPSLELLEEVESLLSSAKVLSPKRVYWDLILTKLYLLRAVGQEEQALALLLSALPQSKRIFGALSSERLQFLVHKSRVLITLRPIAAAKVVDEFVGLLGQSEYKNHSWFKMEVQILRWLVNPSLANAKSYQKSLDYFVNTDSVPGSTQQVRIEAHSAQGPLKAIDVPTSLESFRALIQLAEDLGDEEHEYYGDLLVRYSQRLMDYDSLNLDRSLRNELASVSKKAFDFVSRHQAIECYTYTEALQSRIEQLAFLRDFDEARRHLSLLKIAIRTHKNRGSSQEMYLRCASYINYVECRQKPSQQNIKNYRLAVNRLRAALETSDTFKNDTILDSLRLADFENDFIELRKVAKKGLRVIDPSVNPDLYTACIYFFAQSLIRSGNADAAAQFLAIESHKAYSLREMNNFNKITLILNVLITLNSIYFTNSASQVADTLLKLICSEESLPFQIRRQGLFEIRSAYVRQGEWNKNLEASKAIYNLKDHRNSDLEDSAIHWAKISLEYSRQITLPPSKRDSRKLEQELEEVADIFGKGDLYWDGFYSYLQLLEFDEKIKLLDTVISDYFSEFDPNLIRRLKAQYYKAFLLHKTDPGQAIQILLNLRKEVIKNNINDADMTDYWICHYLARSLLNLKLTEEGALFANLALAQIPSSGYLHHALFLETVGIVCEWAIVSGNYQYAEKLSLELLSEYTMRFGANHKLLIFVWVDIARAQIGLGHQGKFDRTLNYIESNFSKKDFTAELRNLIHEALLRRSNRGKSIRVDESQKT
jgi:hypothetical protein